MRTRIKIGLGIMLFVILAGMLAATISDLNPEDNYWSGEEAINFSFTLDNYTNKSCSLVIDEEVMQTQEAESTNLFTQTLSEGTYLWNVNCSDGNNTEESEERTLHVDLTAPEIILEYPEDEANYSNITEVLFTVTDNLADSLDCELRLNEETQNISAENGTQQNVSIESITGENTWNISCDDMAGNYVNSETRTFNIEEPAPEEVEFSLELEQASYDIGDEALIQITARNNSNVSLEVCPNEQGFVLCYDILEYTSENYPIVRLMPYTNESGDYIIQGLMKYGDLVESYEVEYTVNNNMDINVDGETTINEGETTEIELEVSGGIAPYTYLWSLDGGGTSTSHILNFTYEEPGDHDNIVLVTDAAGNTKTETVSINVKRLYKLTLVVKDAQTDSVISNAMVDIDNTEKTTNENGEATFYLSKGYYDIYASKEGYKYYFEEKYRVEENTTKTIELFTDDLEEPQVSVINPEEGSEILGTELELTFAVEDDSDQVTCDIYTSEGSSSWFAKKETVEAETSEEQTVNLSGFQYSDYKLKIECEDDNGNIGDSPEVTFSFTNETTTTTPSLDDDNLIDRLYDLLDGLPQKNMQEKQVLDALGFEDMIKQAIKTIERTTRDIYSVEYRRDLTDEEKVAKQQELMDNIDELYKTVPSDINVIETKSFIKYIKEDELKPIVQEYLEEEKYSDEKSYLQAAMLTQNEATISTDVKVVKLFYLDGRSEIITLVVKEINYVNESKNFKILEHIPKQIANSTDDMVILTDHVVVKKDPLIEFENPNKIVYYIKGSGNLEEFESLNTLVLPESYSMALTMITGNAIHSGGISLSGTGMLISLIIVLTLIYGAYSLNAFDKFKFYYYVFVGDKKLHNIQMLINDAIDNIDARNFEQAYLIYREVKLYYEKLSLPAKNEVYESVVKVCNRLDFAYAQETLKIINKKLAAGEKEKATHLYKKLRAIYKKLNDKDKNKIYDDILKVSGSVAQ